MSEFANFRNVVYGMVGVGAVATALATGYLLGNKAPADEYPRGEPVPGPGLDRLKGDCRFYEFTVQSARSVRLFERKDKSPGKSFELRNDSVILSAPYLTESHQDLKLGIQYRDGDSTGPYNYDSIPGTGIAKEDLGNGYTATIDSATWSPDGQPTLDLRINAAICKD